MSAGPVCRDRTNSGLHRDCESHLSACTLPCTHLEVITGGGNSCTALQAPSLTLAATHSSHGAPAKGSRRLAQAGSASGCAQTGAHLGGCDAGCGEDLRDSAQEHALRTHTPEAGHRAADELPFTTGTGGTGWLGPCGCGATLVTVLFPWGRWLLLWTDFLEPSPACGDPRWHSTSARTAEPVTRTWVPEALMVDLCFRPA